MNNTLTRKGWGRIYVLHADHVEAVRAIIKELDEFEYGYLPSSLVAPFSEYPNLSYTHKFDSLCMNRLTATCWARGIAIWACDNGTSEYLSDPVPKALAGATVAGSDTPAPPPAPAAER